jgi:N-acetylneuraminate synthase
MADVVIAGRRIGREHPPFVVAEMSGNHNQSLDRALAIVDSVARAGAHALKLQTYTADTMTLDIVEPRYVIGDRQSLWHGQSLYALYQQASTPWEWHEPIFRRCRTLGVVPFSTPFDVSAVDFLETLNAPAYKIASFENVDLPLIARAAATGKPLIISTGLASLGEIDEAVSTAREAGCRDLVLLKCTSSYPAPPESMNLRTIPHLRELFGVEVGLSDHTLGIGVAVAAVGLGATVIEKHVTLTRQDGGVDAAFSLEPDELRQLVEETTRAQAALGRVTYDVTPAEEGSRMFRRSLYVVQDLEPGAMLSAENMRALRPGGGLPPKYYSLLLGRRVSRAVARGTPLGWDLVL